MTKTVAVLGLGAMGLPMATCLAKDFEVRGFDLSAERLALAAESGVKPADQALSAIKDADVVLVAVNNAKQLNSLLFGNQDLVAEMAAGACLMITSTVGIAEIEQLVLKLADYDVHLIDAPISGGPVRAGQGDLLIAVGADEPAWQAGLPVLDALASKLVRVGQRPGQGQSLKVVNQLLCGIHIAAAGEALALAVELGLDPRAALDALMSGAAQSFMLGDRGQRMLDLIDGTEPELRSRLSIFVKDMGIVTAAAKAAGMCVPLAATCEQEFLQSASWGNVDRDDSVIIESFQPRRSDD